MLWNPLHRETWKEIPEFKKGWHINPITCMNKLIFVDYIYFENLFTIPRTNNMCTSVYCILHSY